LGSLSNALERVRAIDVEFCRNIPLIDAEAVRNGVDFFLCIPDEVASCRGRGSIESGEEHKLKPAFRGRRSCEVVGTVTVTAAGGRSSVGVPSPEVFGSLKVDSDLDDLKLGGTARGGM
jgi:hypothetical protein